MNRVLFFMLAIIAFSFMSCNKDEGEGGNGTVQGYVKLIEHSDDNYSLITDTVVASKTDVFIVYGDDNYFGDDVETDDKGFYRFKYLTEGNYTLFSYSTLPSGERIPVSTSASLSKGSTANAPTLYIHSGKAYGTSIIKGKVWAQYYHNSTYNGEGWAYEHRVYIRRLDDTFHFDDVRVGLDGIFAFQKIAPGIYEVFTYTENAAEILSPVVDTIAVDEAGQIIEMQPDTTFVVRIQV